MSRQVFVTGASSGIGASAARILSENGFHLVLAARREDKLRQIAEECKAHGAPSVETVRFDQSKPESIGDLLGKVREDSDLVLVNNAGQARFGPIHTMTDEQVLESFAVNLSGLVLITKGLLEPMLARGGGQIVNVLSIASINAFPGGSLYCATKAGALAFARSLAHDYRREGVRVTSILPGATDTPLWDPMDGHPPREDMISADAVAETIRDVICQPKDRNIDELVLMPPKGFL